MQLKILCQDFKIVRFLLRQSFTNNVCYLETLGSQGFDMIPNIWSTFTGAMNDPLYLIAKRQYDLPQSFSRHLSEVVTSMLSQRIIERIVSDNNVRTTSQRSPEYELNSFSFVVLFLIESQTGYGKDVTI